MTETSRATTTESLLSRMTYAVACIAEREARSPENRELSWSMDGGLQYNDQGRAPLFTAGDLANLIGQSPMVLRRGMARMEKAGIVRIHQGRYGGYTLGRPASSITVYSIYAALYDADQHPVRGAPPVGLKQSHCPVRVVTAQHLGRVYADLDASCRATMESLTIAEVARDASHALENFFATIRENALPSARTT